MQDEIHQNKVYGTVKNELWKIFTVSRYFIIIVLFCQESSSTAANAECEL